MSDEKNEEKSGSLVYSGPDELIMREADHLKRLSTELSERCKELGRPLEPEDRIRLVVAMLLVAAADGEVTQRERATLRAVGATVPDFVGISIDALVDRAAMEIRAGGVRAAVEGLSGFKKETLRRKCFVLAAEIGFCAGGLDDASAQVLALIRRALEIDEAFAQGTLSALAAKYALLPLGTEDRDKPVRVG